MRAVTIQGPKLVRVDERPEPELQARDDAIVRIEASGICGSDLHIYHGRVKIEPGFTIGHEFVGTVIAAGEDVTRVSVGDRVLGCFQAACGTCFFCLRGAFHKCDRARVFGHGELARRPPGHPGRPGARADGQPDPAPRPRGRLRRRRPVRRRRDGHRLPRRVRERRAPGRQRRRARPRARSGCARSRSRSAAGAGPVFAIDTVRGAARRGPPVRRGPGAPDRAEPARRDPRRHREARRRRRHRRRRASRRARHGDPPDPQGRHACSPSASTPSPARSTWAWSGSRR